MTKRKTIKQDLPAEPIESGNVSMETDQQILEQIDKRREENQALKKLLHNLNSSILKTGASDPKR